MFDYPIYRDEFGGMEEYDMLAEDNDEELYEEYIDEFNERYDLF